MDLMHDQLLELTKAIEKHLKCIYWVHAIILKINDIAQAINAPKLFLFEGL